MRSALNGEKKVSLVTEAFEPVRKLIIMADKNEN